MAKIRSAKEKMHAIQTGSGIKKEEDEFAFFNPGFEQSGSVITLTDHPGLGMLDYQSSGHTGFCSEEAFVDHSTDADQHLQPTERQAWNAKADAKDLLDHENDRGMHMTWEDRIRWDAMAPDENFQDHTGNTTRHITAIERSTWNDKPSNADFYAHANDNEKHVSPDEQLLWDNMTPQVTFDGHNNNNVRHITAAERSAWNKNIVDYDLHKTFTASEAAELDAHMANTVPHITAAERTKWNTVKAGGVPSGGVVGQSLVKVSSADGDVKWDDPDTGVAGHYVQGVDFSGDIQTWLDNSINSRHFNNNLTIELKSAPLTDLYFDEIMFTRANMQFTLILPSTSVARSIVLREITGDVDIQIADNNKMYSVYLYECLRAYFGNSVLSLATLEVHKTPTILASETVSITNMSMYEVGFVLLDKTVTNAQFSGQVYLSESSTLMINMSSTAILNTAQTIQSSGGTIKDNRHGRYDSLDTYLRPSINDWVLQEKAIGALFVDRRMIYEKCYQFDLTLTEHEGQVDIADLDDFSGKTLTGEYSGILIVPDSQIIKPDGGVYARQHLIPSIVTHERETNSNNYTSFRLNVSLAGRLQMCAYKNLSYPLERQFTYKGYVKVRYIKNTDSPLL